MEIEFVNNFWLVHRFYELCKCGYCEKCVCVCVCVCVCWVWVPWVIILVRCECWVVGAVRWECEWCIKVSEVRVLCGLVGCIVWVPWESVWLWEKRSVWWVGYVNEKKRESVVWVNEKKRVVQWVGLGREKRKSVVLCDDENECCEVREFCVEVNSVCVLWLRWESATWNKKKCVGCGSHVCERKESEWGVGFIMIFLIPNMPRLNQNQGSKSNFLLWLG